MRCRGEAHTTQTAHRQRWRAGGGFLNSAAAGMCRRRLSWQGAPVHPSSALPCSPHIVLPGRQVGGGAPQQLRSTIALAGSRRPKKASVEAHQAAGDQSTSNNFSSSHHSNVSLSQIDQKLLSGRSHLSSSAAHGLLRMLPFLGCGSNETSILDLT